MVNEIEDVNIIAGELLITLNDGREALIRNEDLIGYAERTGAFERADALRIEDDDDSAPDTHVP